MDRLRHHEQLPVEADVDDRIEVWEPDSNDRIRPASRPAFRGRFTTSAPGAVAGAFLVCAIALGASVGSTSPATAPAGDTAALDAAAGGTAGKALLANGDGNEYDRSDGDHYGGDAKPDTEPAEDPKPGADEPKPDTEEPKEPPKDEPDPAPDVHKIDLALALGSSGSVKLDWGACEVDGFIAWKVIRATDGTPTYPRGEGDVLAGVVEKQGQTAFTDTSAPAGKKLSYAVFGLGGDGYARNIACVSNTASIATPAEAPKPDPKPEPPKDPPAESPSMSLALSIKEGAIYVDWSGCEADGAEVYKVVRSSNSSVSWPAGEGDTLIAAVGIGDKTAAWDEHAPAGKKVWYRVFCVRHTDNGYKVLVASAVRAIVAPAGDPAPKPSAMWIEVSAEGGNVVVHWEACGGESFSHYRIVRKVDGVSTVVTEIENAGVTTWVDDSVEAGKTYKYFVQSKGIIDGSYVLLGTTDYAAVTVE